MVKLIVVEVGTDETREAAQHADVLATSPVAYAEARAALARIRVDRRLSNTDRDAARQALEKRWTDMAKVDMDPGVIARAGDVAERHALRALDALHVASAISLASRSSEPLIFASWDRDQRSGAQQERLSLFPETL